MNFLKFSFLLIFISLIVGLMPSFFKFAFNNSQSAEVVSFKTLRNVDKIRAIFAGSAKIPVYLADTEEKRAKGLGGLASIPRGYGMFFIFDSSGYQNIWMKDMLFPIDIVWINDNFIIVHIERNISPETYPNTFTSPFTARFVLELYAGTSEFYDLRVGQTIALGSN